MIGEGNVNGGCGDAASAVMLPQQSLAIIGPSIGASSNLLPIKSKRNGVPPLMPIDAARLSAGILF